MVACPRCGSRRVRQARTPLALAMRLLSAERRTVCLGCGWRGWKSAHEWQFARDGQLDGASRFRRWWTSPRGRAARYWILAGTAALALVALAVSC